MSFYLGSRLSLPDCALIRAGEQVRKNILRARCGASGALQVKTEPIRAIRGGYRRPFQRGCRRGVSRGYNRCWADRRYFNCDQSGFTPDHIAKSLAKNATCKFCRQIGQYERPCRGRIVVGRGRTGLINKKRFPTGAGPKHIELW